MTTPHPIPLRPDFDSVRELSLRSLSRASIAVAEHALAGGWTPGALGPSDYLRQRSWSDDRVASMLVRSPTSPATTSQANWAQELATVAKAFLTVLVPMSAGASLLAQGLSLSFGEGYAKISLPTIGAGSASFVTQGQPIRVGQIFTSGGPTLEPAKFASIVSLTREMIESGNAESLVRQAMVDATAVALDAALFSNAAAVPDLRPAGILLGAISVPPSSNDIPSEAMADDISTLVEAISSFAGNGNIALVCAPAQWVRILLCANRLPFAVLASSAVPTGQVNCIALNALASVVEPVMVDAGKQVSFHSEDTNPQPVGTAAPHISTWQTDSVALRVKLPVTWALRDARAVSFVTATKW
jgi:hypothetical protein